MSYWLAILFTFALGTAAVGLNAVVAFWAAYILTRPLGASLGDFLSQSADDGGLGLGTTVTSAAFLATVLVLVTFLSLTRKDATETRRRGSEPAGIQTEPGLLEESDAPAPRS